MMPDWPTALTPVLVVLVPLLLSQAKKLLRGQTWMIPLLAPLVGIALNVVSGLATQTQTGTAKAALLGLAGVGLREIIDQLRQAATPPSSNA